MRLRDLLRRADDRLVPRAASTVAGWRERGRARAAGVAGWRPQVRSRRLRALDDRFTASGPLALVRDLPQLGFVVIGLVLVLGAVTAASQESARAREDRSTAVLPDAPGVPLPAAPVDNVLGPVVGSTVPAYLRAAGATLAAAAKRSPDSPRVALVSFSDYRDPAQVRAMLSGYKVLRVFLRAKAAGKEAAQLPVDVHGDLLTDLRAAYAQTARLRLQAQKSYQGYVDSLTVTTREDQQFKDLYAAFARSTGIEAQAYRSGCACVYAAVVAAEAKALPRLTGRPAVRAVQPAGAGLGLSQLQVLPLLPEVTGTVPQQQASETQP